MSSDDFNQLGAAERFAAQTFIREITKCLDASRKLASQFSRIDISEENVERLFLDSKKKEQILTTMPMLERLSDNLEASSMVSYILEIIAKEKESTSA